MKKAETLRWLEQIITTHNVYQATQEKECEKIRLCLVGDIHVCDGIEYFADAAGVVLGLKIHGSANYPYEYWFEYKGVRIFQRQNERELKEVHWDED